MTTGTERDDRRRWRSLAAFGILAAGVIAAGVGVFAGGEAVEVATGVAVVAAIVAASVGMRVNNVATGTPWLLLTGAFLAWATGGLLNGRLDTFRDLTENRSLLPEIFGLSGYALFIAGGYLLLRDLYAGAARNFDAALDAGIIAVTITTLAWGICVLPRIDENIPLLAELSLAAYPTLAVGLVAFIIRLAFMMRSEDAQYAQVAVAAAVVGMAVGEVVALLADISILDLSATESNVPYVVAFAAAGSGLLHPTARPPAGFPSVDSGPRPPRLWLISAALAAPWVAAVFPNGSEIEHQLSLIFIGVVLVVLVGWRIRRVLAEWVQPPQAAGATDPAVALRGHVGSWATDTDPPVAVGVAAFRSPNPAETAAALDLVRPSASALAVMDDFTVALVVALSADQDVDVVVDECLSELGDKATGVAVHVVSQTAPVGEWFAMIDVTVEASRRITPETPKLRVEHKLPRSG